MGMNFVIAESIEEAYRIASSVEESFRIVEGIEESVVADFARLDDYMCDLIYKNIPIWCDDIDVFIELDPYNNVVIEVDELESFIIASKALIKEDALADLDSTNEFKNHDIEKKEFIAFANSMIKAFTFALANNKKIVSLGD